MKCPTCGTYVRVLETRDKPNNQTYRRYECANMHRFSTIESLKEKKNATPTSTI
jgi:transcriptional regulator NrdR family protein